jgi:hypothetical protein
MLHVISREINPASGIVPIWPHNTPTGHTQPAQNSNSHFCALVRAKIYVFNFPAMFMAMAMRWFMRG